MGPAAKANMKRANVRLDENVPVARGNATCEVVAAKCGQHCLVVVIENSVSSASEAAADTAPANVRSVQVVGGVGSQQRTRSAGPRREEEDAVVVVAPSIAGQGCTEVANTVAVLAQAGDDGITKVEEMIENLKMDNLFCMGC